MGSMKMRLGNTSIAWRRIVVSLAWRKKVQGAEEQLASDCRNFDDDI